MYQYMLLQALTAGPSKVCSVAPYSLLGPTVSVVTYTVGELVTLFRIDVDDV